MVKYYIVIDIYHPQHVTTLSDLAKKSAILTTTLKNILYEHIINESKIKQESKLISSQIGQIFSLYQIFKGNIIVDFSYKDFAESFSQAIIFSALFAKITLPKDNISIKSSTYKCFEFCPLIKEILQYFGNLDNVKYQDVLTAIDNIFTFFNNIPNISDIFYINNNTDRYIEFYDLFLSHYNKDIKFDRGAFCTPKNIAEYIIRETNYLIKDNFNCEDGFGDSRIKTLDFACGTGTFLMEIYKAINCTDHQIERNIYGFEIMLAPYIIANLRLQQLLQSPVKLPIFLTNTLEKTENVKLCPLPEINNEATKALDIKNQNIVVIIGNPPYSIKSHNNNDYISELLTGIDRSGKFIHDGYFHINKIKQKYTQSLYDDYVKFICFAENKIAESPHGGIVSIVLNHGFIDNPSFKSMRYHLMQTFDDMYFIDLNGNFRRRKTDQDGIKDQNIIPVKQGICIAFFIKHPPYNNVTNKNIFHTEIIGDKASKMAKLFTINLAEKNHWNKVNITEQFYSFKPSKNNCVKYNNVISLPDVFLEYGSGITTGRDNFALNITKEALLCRLIDFAKSDLNTDLYTKFNITNNNKWDIYKVHQKFQKYNINELEMLIKPIHFRGFDIRYIIYDPTIVESITKIMHNISDNNIALCFAAREIDTHFYSSIFVTNKITSSAMHYYGTKVAPMYLHFRGNIAPNFSQYFYKQLQAKYTHTPTTEQIFGYLYGFLYNTEYRRKYVDYLSIDYPRIWLSETIEEFFHISKYGQSLINLHLLKKCSKNFTFKGDNYVIQNVFHSEDNKLYINKTSYFENITQEIYNFKVGCYPVLEKYLKPRKNLDIKQNVNYVINVCNAIKQTIEMPC